MSTVRPLRAQDIEDPDLPIAYALLREQAAAADAALIIDFGVSPIELSVRTANGKTLTAVTVRGKLSGALRAAAGALRANAA